MHFTRALKWYAKAVEATNALGTDFRIHVYAAKRLVSSKNDCTISQKCF